MLLRWIVNYKGYSFYIIWLLSVVCTKVDTLCQRITWSPINWIHFNLSSFRTENNNKLSFNFVLSSKLNCLFVRNKLKLLRVVCFSDFDLLSVCRRYWWYGRLWDWIMFGRDKGAQMRSAPKHLHIILKLQANIGCFWMSHFQMIVNHLKFLDTQNSIGWQ